MNRPSTALLALVVATIACHASVRTRESRDHSREACRSAATQVAAGAESFAAFVTLGWCDESGPPVIAARWAAATPHDSLALRGFFFASGNLRDGRIFEAAYAAAIDSVRPAYERGAALLVLVAQLDPSAAIMTTTGVNGNPWRALLGQSMHRGSQAGTRPLPNDARQRVIAFVRSIAGDRPGSLARMFEPLYEAATSAHHALQRSSL